MGSQGEQDRLFPDIGAETNEPSVTEIESLCTQCMDNGMTRLLLTRIPFFREVIISSFECGKCAFRNNEIQSGGAIQEQGVRYTLTAKREADLNRQVVRSDMATVRIPELEFEIPPKTQRGALTTVEGIIDRACDGILQQQQLRMLEHPELAGQLALFVVRMRQLKDFAAPFTLVVEDPTGNSFVETPCAPSPDPDLGVEHYTRTAAVDRELGILANGNGEGGAAGNDGTGNGSGGDAPDESDVTPEEVIELPTNCSSCSAPIMVRMKTIKIPFFKEVIIMATSCDACGFRDNEVKSGSGIEPTGVRYTLKLTDPSDLSRDVLKSDTCSLAIPELEFSSEHGTLGGRFTTLEGLLTNVKDQLQGSNPFVMGDSAEASEMGSKMRSFLEVFSKVISGELLNVHVILEDPAGNSYLQNLYAPEADPELKIERYERSYEQREILGLNDMKTENYGEPDS